MGFIWAYLVIQAIIDVVARIYYTRKGEMTGEW